MLPYHHMLITEAQFAAERRNRELEHRRLHWEAREQAQTDKPVTGTRPLSAACRRLATLVGGLVRTESRTPADAGLGT